MNKTTQLFMQKFEKLSPLDQRSLLGCLLQHAAHKSSRSAKGIPTVKLPGGRITSQQVAEALDDE